jgi:phosphatidylinositol glycan class B
MAAKLLMVLISLLGIEIGRRMAARLGGPMAGLVVTLVLTTCPLLIFFSPKVMTENASGVLLLAAAHLLLTATRPRPALAGALASLSIFLRYQNGVVVVGLLVVAAWQDRRSALRYLAAATAMGIAGGMLDWITWSYPFQAFWNYVKYNVIDNRGTANGTSPFDYFAIHLASSMGPALGLLFLGGAVGARRAPGLTVIVLVYFVVHSLVPHKEMRFLLPLLPLALVLAGVGLTELLEAWSARPAPTLAVAVVVSLALLAHAWQPTQRELGLSNSDTPLWHSGEDYLVTTLRASDQPDLCGIALVGNYPTSTGGYSYLHRNVPMYFDTTHLPSANYVVGQHDEALPLLYKRVFVYGSYALFRRDGRCVPDPDHRAWIN